MSDKIKLLPAEWEVVDNVAIMDPDGWDRTNLKESWNTPIDRDEWLRRYAVSTVAPLEAKEIDSAFIARTEEKWQKLQELQNREEG